MSKTPRTDEILKHAIAPLAALDAVDANFARSLELELAASVNALAHICPLPSTTPEEHEGNKEFIRRSIQDRFKVAQLEAIIATGKAEIVEADETINRLSENLRLMREDRNQLVSDNETFGKANDSAKEQVRQQSEALDRCDEEIKRLNTAIDVLGATVRAHQQTVTNLSGRESGLHIELNLARTSAKAYEDSLQTALQANNILRDQTQQRVDELNKELEAFKNPHATNGLWPKLHDANRDNGILLCKLRLADQRLTELTAVADDYRVKYENAATVNADQEKEIAELRRFKSNFKTIDRLTENELVSKIRHATQELARRSSRSPVSALQALGKSISESGIDALISGINLPKPFVYGGNVHTGTTSKVMDAQANQRIERLPLVTEVIDFINRKPTLPPGVYKGDARGYFSDANGNVWKMIPSFNKCTPSVIIELIYDAGQAPRSQA